ncbi:MULTISPECIES: glycosyltransferase family 4 protein [Campylobacter]|nr:MULTISPECIES: glycosyltransferase family 4 protein [Campylobacter]
MEATIYALPCIAFDINAVPSDITENEKMDF